MTGQQIVLLVVQVSIFLTVFGFGLQATRDDLLYLVRRPGMLVRRRWWPCSSSCPCSL